MTLDAAIDRIRLEGPSGSKIKEFADVAADFLSTAAGGAAVGGASITKAGGTASRPIGEQLADGIAAWDWGGTETVQASIKANVGGKHGQTCLVGGYYAAGDGGGGLFIWDANCALTDDGGVIVNPTGNAGNGRWRRIVSDKINVRWFGAKGDNIADDTAAIQAAITYAVAQTVSGNQTHPEVYIPSGFYLITTIDIIGANSNNLVISGAGTFNTTLCSSAVQSAYELTGTASSGTFNTLVMPTGIGASAADDYYNNEYTIKIVSGTGAGQSRQIYDYTGSTRTVNVRPSWTTNPNNTSVFEIWKGKNAVIIRGSYITIRDLNVYSTTARQSSYGHGIYADNGTSTTQAALTIERVVVRNQPCDGFFFIKPELAKLMECTANANGRRGFVLTDAGTLKGIANTLFMCRTYLNGMEGIHLWNMLNSTIYNNECLWDGQIVEGSTVVAVAMMYVQSGRNVAIIEPDIEHNTPTGRTGLYVTGLGHSLKGGLFNLFVLGVVVDSHTGFRMLSPPHFIGASSTHMTAAVKITATASDTQVHLRGSYTNVDALVSDLSSGKYYGTVGTEIFYPNLPTAAGSTGSLYVDASGFVKRA